MAEVINTFSNSFQNFAVQVAPGIAVAVGIGAVILGAKITWRLIKGLAR